MRSKLRIIYFNVSLFCVLLVGLELAGQVVFFLLKGYPVYASAEHPEPALTWHHQLLERHPYLVGRLKAGVRAEQNGKIARTTAMHTRWTGAPPLSDSVIRIATIGGSTTFGAGLSDAETWPAQLQALLGPKFAVTNYGLLGYSSAEGVIQMALLVPETRPDIVVMYEGWNDLHNYHRPGLGPDYYGHGVTQFSTLAVDPPTHESLLTRLGNISAICHLALMLARPEASATAPTTATMAAFAEPDSVVDRLYLRNLRTMRSLAGQSGAYALFVPQVLNRSWYLTHAGGDWWTPGIANVAMPVLLDRLNGKMSEVCRAGARDCSVLGSVSTAPWDSTDFLDEGHFSASGSEAFAHLVAAGIRQVLTRRPQLRPGDETRLTSKTRPENDRAGLHQDTGAGH